MVRFTSHARGRTLSPAGEEAEDAAEVIRHLVITDQDLLHRLGQRHTGKHLRELRAGRGLGLLSAVLNLRRHGLFYWSMVKIDACDWLLKCYLEGLDPAFRQISPANLLSDGELLEPLLESSADLVALQPLDAGQEGEPDHDTRRLARHPDHVEAGGRMLGVLSEVSI